MSTRQTAAAKKKPVDPLERFLRAAKKSIDREAWEEAEEAGTAYLEKAPETPEVWFVLALAAFNLNDMAMAATHVKRAFDVQPNVQEHASLLSVFYALAGDLSTSAYYAKLVYALPSVERLRRLIPETFPTFSRVFQDISESPLLRRGTDALSRQAWEDAEHWYRQHLAFDSESREAHAGLGLTLLAQGLPRHAVEALRAGRHAHPFDAQIASHLGSALTSIGAFSESHACHRWAQAQAPDDPGVHAMATLDRLHDPDAGTDETVAAFRQWGRKFAVIDDEPAQFARPEPKDTLTIGYIVGGRGGTPGGIALSSILARHDPERFQTVGFGFGSLSDASNIVLQKCMSRWHDVANIDPLTLRAIVTAEEVDILVDAAGFSSPKLLTALGLRAAPCQVAWMESPLGTGIESVDFLITDKVLDPDGSGDGLYIEELAYLELGSVVAETLVGEEPMAPRPEGAELTFAADVGLMEITPRAVECWAAILHRAPDAKLVLRDRGFKNDENAAQLVGLFGDFGLAHRVDVIEEPVPSKFFELADVALLPLPFPPPQGALDALWGGAPVVCLAGDGRHMRQTASLLHHMEIGEGMVAASLGEYADLALAWAQDAERRRAFRADVRARMGAAKNADPAVRVKNLERLFASMWQQVCDR